MKICFASLRKKINYTEVLEYGMDVFYECFKNYTNNNKQHEYSYYNFAYANKGAERNLNAIRSRSYNIPSCTRIYIFCKRYAPKRC